jgi:hypothetical protein
MKTRRRQHGGDNALAFYKPTQIRQRVGVPKMPNLQELAIGNATNIPSNVVSAPSSNSVKGESFSFNNPEHGMVEMAAPAGLKQQAAITRRNNLRVANPVNKNNPNKHTNNTKRASLVKYNRSSLVRNTGTRALLRKFRARK